MIRKITLEQLENITKRTINEMIGEDKGEVTEFKKKLNDYIMSKIDIAEKRASIQQKKLDGENYSQMVSQSILRARLSAYNDILNWIGSVY